MPGEPGSLEDLVAIFPRGECRGPLGPASLVTLHADGALTPRPLDGVGTALAIAAGYVDGDGSPDLIIGHTGGVHLLRGPEFTDALRFETLRLPTAVGAVHADGGGTRKIIVLDRAGSVLLDASTGSSHPVPDAPGGTSLVIADVDGDGLEDVLVGDGAQVHVLIAVPHVRLAPSGSPR
jgi:hypothetical protein